MARDCRNTDGAGDDVGDGPTRNAKSRCGAQGEEWNKARR